MQSFQVLQEKLKDMYNIEKCLLLETNVSAGSVKHGTFMEAYYIDIILYLDCCTIKKTHYYWHQNHSWTLNVLTFLLSNSYTSFSFLSFNFFHSQKSSIFFTHNINLYDTFVNIIFWKPILHYVYIYVVLYISSNSTFTWSIYWFVTTCSWNLKYFFLNTI